MNQETLLYRQVPSYHIQCGHVSSCVFRPRKTRDNNKLSVYDGDKITPEKAFIHYTEQLKADSIGILSISNLECLAEELQVYGDYKSNPYHVLIDFSLRTDFIKEISERLKNNALKRVWLIRK